MREDGGNASSWGASHQIPVLPFFSAPPREPATPRAYNRGVDIEYALIADYAEIVAGKLYLMGGGWDSFALSAVPGQLRLALAVGVRIGWEETNRSIPVQATVEDDDGRQVAKLEAAVNAGRPPNLAPGTGQLAQLAAHFIVPVETAGGHRVTIIVGDQSRYLPFRVTPPRA